MLFMNEYDIDDVSRRFSKGDTPNLQAGAEILERLKTWTNRNSDGWAYWPKPARAAKKLMELLQSRDPWKMPAIDRFHPEDCTDAELAAACRPIKSFLTRQGVDHSTIFTH